MAWTEETIEAVWRKGKAVAGEEATRWRKDECAAWIGRVEYGDRKSQYGWEIDHVDRRGGDGIGNLRPLQWQNNVDKSDGRLQCNVTASGQSNVSK